MYIPKLTDTCISGVNLAGCIKEFNSIAGDGVEGLYYHDGSGSYINADQEAGDDSYRFSGANPNNYVCFGSTATTCPNDNLYRIIGVFGNQVKLIKHDYATTSLLGTNGAAVGFEYLRTWNNITNNNIWSESNLNTVNLNQNYLNNIGSTWSSKIATTNWKVGGMGFSYSNTAKQYYTTELGSSSSSTTYSAKIGLMYVSDFGYAAYPSYWTTELYNYEPSKSSNWLAGVMEWTITRNSDSTDYAFRVYDTGIVVGSNTVHTTLNAVRPTFYLNSNVTLSGGSGTESDPYKLSV